MRVDAHMHMNFRNISPRNIIDYLDRNEFESCWLMTWEENNRGNWYYEHLCVEDVYEAYSLFPSRIVPMYAPDPNSEDAPQKLLDWHQQGIRGCAELKVTLNWQSEKIKRLLSTVTDLKIPLVFHMEESSEKLGPLESDSALERLLLRIVDDQCLSGAPNKLFNILSHYCKSILDWKREHLVFPGYLLDFASLGSVLDQYPSIIFIGHGPLFWKHIAAEKKKNPSMQAGEIEQEGLVSHFLRNYPNLYADISAPSGYYALDRDHAFAGKFLTEFDNKLLFGTDNYFLGHEKLLDSLNLSAKSMEKIMGSNSQKVLGYADTTQQMVS